MTSGPAPAPVHEAGPLPSKDRSVKPWVGLLARLCLAGVLGYAGWTKIIDLPGSLQSVLAYEIVNYDLARWISIFLPLVELALAFLLLLGLLTRPAAVLSAALMVVFIAGIVSAWARGLTIDCGCFGTGGHVAPDQTQYLSEILRDLAFLGLAVWLSVWPRTRWAFDNRLTPHTQKGL